MTFFPDYENTVRGSGPGVWFLFTRQETGYAVLTESDGPEPRIPRITDFDRIKLQPANMFYIGMLDEHPCFTGVLDPDIPLPGGYLFAEARSLFGVMERGVEEALSRARGIVQWDTANRFCSRCGTGLTTGSAEPVKICTSCGFTVYPRITPAVIILIRKGKSILLAHNKRFPENLYSCVAGFVETGESLEDAARREIEEETGIRVENLRYFGSQPWPFPNSLMVAFLADYAGGEIQLEDDDISDAKWFSRDNLPNLPMKGSISRRMIDGFLGEDYLFPTGAR